MVGLQFEHLAVPVGDAGMIAVAGKEGQLGARRGLDPADDEPHRRGARPVLPECSAAAAAMQSPPDKAEATRVISLSPALARPGASPRSTCCSTS